MLRGFVKYLVTKTGIIWTNVTHRWGKLINNNYAAALILLCVNLKELFVHILTSYLSNHSLVIETLFSKLENRLAISSTAAVVKQRSKSLLN